MLLLSPGMERERTWLSDRLWSSRGRAQGQASLRQELCNLRKALKAHPGCLEVTRQRVRIRPGGIVPGPAIPGEELLAGLDIPDAEGFEDWLRQERSRATAAPVGPVTEAAPAPRRGALPEPSAGALTLRLCPMRPAARRMTPRARSCVRCCWRRWPRSSRSKGASE